MDFFIEKSPLISLVFFFAIFIFILFRTYKPSQKKQIESNANIPLKRD
mgnify:CR=1 FL=1